MPTLSLSPIGMVMVGAAVVAALSFIWLMVYTRGQKNYSFYTLQAQILDRKWGEALPGGLFVISFLVLIMAAGPLFWSLGWTWIGVVWSALSLWILLNVWANFRRGAAQRKRKLEKENADPFSAEAIIRQRRKANKRRKSNKR